MRSVSFSCLVTGALLLCAPAGRSAGDTIAWNSNGSSLTVYGSGGGNPPAAPTDAVLTPINLPTSGVITTSGDFYHSTDTYVLSSSQLTVGFDQYRGGLGWTYAQSVGAFVFTVDPNADTTYNTAGVFNVNDVSQPSLVCYDTYLVDLTTNSTFFFQRYNESIDVPSVSFSLGSGDTGSTNGDRTNIVYGSLNGNLFAGHTYELYHNYFIETVRSPGDGGATATGYLSLGIGASAVAPPSPNPLVPVPPVFLTGIALLGCAGMMYGLRHRSAALA
jgi:hypothetical protein